MTTDYAYDGLGQRLSATAGGTVTDFLWDPAAMLPDLALERDGSGATINRYVYGADLLSMRDGQGSEYFYHHDALGTVVGLSSNAGAAVADYGYEPFGAARATSQGGPANPMRFTGEYQDPTGLYHLRARQYDPSTGRFTTPDPIPASGVSTYAYADSQPTALVDPSGLRGSSPGSDCVVDRSPFPAGSYWDIRSHRGFWDEQAEAGLTNPSGFVGFFQWAGGKVFGGALAFSHLESVQASAETLGTPCTSFSDKAASVATIIGVGASWYLAASTTATGASKAIFGSNARTGSRIFGLRNRFGPKFYTDPHGFFLAIDKVRHRLHVLRWKGL